MAHVILPGSTQQRSSEEHIKTGQTTANAVVEDPSTAEKTIGAADACASPSIDIRKLSSRSQSMMQTKSGLHLHRNSVSAWDELVQKLQEQVLKLEAKILSPKTNSISKGRRIR